MAEKKSDSSSPTQEDFSGASNSSNNPHFDKKDEEVLLQPFRYLLQVPGKMIRNKLAQAFNYWMKIPEEKLSAISEIILMLHNASLIIDDIEDGSVLRRGIPVAHSIYGVASSINTANYVYFLGLQKTLALNHPQAVNVFCEQLLELHRGQGQDIHWRDSYTCPTEEQYKNMTIRKTGGLFGLAIRLMQLFSDCESNFTKLTDILGLYFQIRDDYANLCMKEYSDNKSYCEDLTEGKFSFPVIHAIRTRPDCLSVINIIRQRPKDLDVKRYCVSLLEKYGSLAYTVDTLKHLNDEAKVEIEKLGGNPFLEKILNSLSCEKLTKEASVETNGVHSSCTENIREKLVCAEQTDKANKVAQATCKKSSSCCNKSSEIKSINIPCDGSSGYCDRRDKCEYSSTILDMDVNCCGAKRSHDVSLTGSLTSTKRKVSASEDE